MAPGLGPKNSATGTEKIFRALHECFFEWQSRCQVPSYYNRCVQQVRMDHATENENREGHHGSVRVYR